MSDCICFVGNQGGQEVLSFYQGMAQGLWYKSDKKIQSAFTTWIRDDSKWLQNKGVSSENIYCYEDYVECESDNNVDAEAEYLNISYPQVRWSQLIAAERSFTDYSFLLGGAGNRIETQEYISHLLYSLVRFFECVYNEKKPLAVVTQTSDTLLSFVAIKVAQQKRLPVRSIVPAWLLEPNSEGGFLVADEFMHSHSMMKRYKELSIDSLSKIELHRVKLLEKSIINFDGNTAFYKAHDRGRPRLLSPHIRRILHYIKQNNALDKNIVYTRFSIKSKLLANLMRLWRKWRAHNLLGEKDLSNIPEKSVFYALHMQPEQSTLAQGIWYVNQVALIENISKSLPVGYTLLVKEHPVNRGFRPVWQYIHLRNLYNVQFIDAPSKSIVRKVQAVITITGTIGMEALVLRKPVIMLGNNFYDFCELLYRPSGIEDLPDLLYRILVDRDYPVGKDLDDQIHIFLAAYLDSLIPAYPMPQNGVIWGEYLWQDIQRNGSFSSSAAS